MKSRVVACAMLLSVLVTGCPRTSGPQGTHGTSPTNLDTVASEPGTPDNRRQAESPTNDNKERIALSTEDEVVEYLATHELLTQVFIDPTSPIRQTRLKLHFIDWLALGDNEPLDQRLALAQVFLFGHGLLKDTTYFDGGYRDSVKASLRYGTLTCEITTIPLLREDKNYPKNYLTIAEQALASDVRQKLIVSADDTMNKDFDSELAGYTSRTLAFIKKDAPPNMAEVHTALRQAIRKALSAHPELAASLKEKLKISADVRASHERVGKMIQAASGG